MRAAAKALAAAATALLGALTAHPSLQTLSLGYDAVNDALAAAALGALVGANAPMLRTLLVYQCFLGDAGLGPLADALPANTHLRCLAVSGNDVSEAFVRDRLLPAVRANASLTHLELDFNSRAALEAEALVMARAAR
jgi:hypothetical protein